MTWWQRLWRLTGMLVGVAIAGVLLVLTGWLLWNAAWFLSPDAPTIGRLVCLGADKPVLDLTARDVMHTGGGLRFTAPDGRVWRVWETSCLLIEGAEAPMPQATKAP